jgi:tetratricopeptide (TPR) repeat protein
MGGERSLIEGPLAASEAHARNARFDLALDAALDAVRIAEQCVSEEDPASVRAWTRANVAVANQQRVAGSLGDAEDRLLAVIETVEAMFGVDDWQLAHALNALGIVYKYAARFDESERSYQRALQIADRDRRPEAVSLMSIYHNLGGLEHARGRPHAGIDWAERGLEARAAGASDDPGLAADLAALASLYHDVGRLDEAQKTFTRALELFERLYGSNHYEVGVTCGGLALVLARQGAPAEALALQRRCLEIKQEALGAEHPDTALSAHNLAVQLANEGRDGEALDVLRGAEATFARIYPTGHPRLARTRAALAKLQSRAAAR